MAVPGIGDSLEGLHTVAAALDAGRVISLTVERRRADSDDITSLLGQAEARRVPVKFVDDVRPLAATSAPQGVVAKARPLPTTSLREMVEQSSLPALIILDHAEDPRNVGAIARSAVAAGIDGMVVSSRRSAPLGATAFKAAVGSFEKLAITIVPSIADAVRSLKNLDVWTVALDGTAAESFYDLRILEDPVAVIVGAEGRGVSRLVADRSDVVARLPMAPGIESLNAGVAASLAMFEVGRARGTLV
ncbi:MAG: RNA methyltransferase [bacterium]|nr:RNA methyltransferase [bacterium]